MENQPQHYHQIQNQQQPGSEENSGGGGGKGGSYVCRQSSTRWTPTTDQINILRGLYYNSGVRSPSAEQIQSITARLRQYGKIEGKNVFYWFQNHKARERQKKRFTSVTDHHHHHVSALQPQPPPPPPQQPPSLKWEQPEDYSCFHGNTYLHNNSNSPGISSPSSSSAGRHMGNYGHGSVTMEKNFRDCSISAGVGSMSTNYGWVSSYSSFFNKQKSSNKTLEEDDDEEEQEEEEDGPEIKTLPLFPTQREEEINGFCNIKHNSIRYSHNWYGYGGYGGFEDGLELSLKSCSTGQAPDSL